MGNLLTNMNHIDTRVALRYNGQLNSTVGVIARWLFFSVHSHLSYTVY